MEHLSKVGKAQYVEIELEPIIPKLSADGEEFICLQISLKSGDSGYDKILIETAVFSW